MLDAPLYYIEKLWEAAKKSSTSGPTLKRGRGGKGHYEKVTFFGALKNFRKKMLRGGGGWLGS